MKPRHALLFAFVGFTGLVYASEGPSSETAPAHKKPEAVEAEMPPKREPGEATEEKHGETRDAEHPAPASDAAAPAAAESREPSVAEKPASTKSESTGSIGKDEIESLIKYAQNASNEGRLDMAQLAYSQLLTKHLTTGQQRVVLLGFARLLRKKSDLTKSVAVYEKLLKDYPMDETTPEIYLELGRTQRALGAYKTAIARFYSVINSTIKLPEDGAYKYRQLAKTAQFEIAETYFLAGNYQEASRFYSRLRLLDLAPSDRAKAHFKAAYSLSLAEDHLAAVTALRAYIDLNPDDENVPEAHYLLAVSYRRLNRPLEALVEAMELLRMEKTKTAKDPKRWAYWQRKTGNQIANEFYEQGDFPHAMTIYQTLADLNIEPSWRLPVVYQIGLCHERLGQIEESIACYQSILDNSKASKGDSTQQSDLSDLFQMASWRLNQIKWQHSTEQNLTSLLPPQRSTPAPQASPNKNDASGNTAAAPAPVR